MLRPIGRQRQFKSSASVFPSGCDYTGSSVAPKKTSPGKRSFRKHRSPAASANAWTQRTSDGVCTLQVNALNKLPWLVHGFSTRPGGVSALVGRSAVAQEKVEQVLNLGFAEWDSRENVLENRRRFQFALGAGEFALISLKQFHSDVVHVFETAPADPCRGDASVTNQPGLLLGVQTADCVPFFSLIPENVLSPPSTRAGVALCNVSS